MVSLVTDPLLEERLIEERRNAGVDRFDEVWEGIYVITPPVDDEHQDLVTGISAKLRSAIQEDSRGLVRAGTNISDQREDWTFNDRCPDVAVFLNETQAENCDTHWYGGPDFAVEIVSPGDRTREKLDFYAKVGTRELLIVDRDPWALELYRLEDGKLVQAGRSTTDDSSMLDSRVLPVTWRLVSGETRPQIEITYTDGRRQWTV